MRGIFRVCAGMRMSVAGSADFSRYPCAIDHLPARGSCTTMMAYSDISRLGRSLRVPRSAAKLARPSSARLSEHGFQSPWVLRVSEDASLLLGRTRLNDTLDNSNRILVYATPYCGDTRRARRVLDELGICYDFIDIRRDEAAALYVEGLTGGFRSSPTIVFPDGDIFVEPSQGTLRAKLEALLAAGHEPTQSASA